MTTLRYTLWIFAATLPFLGTWLFKWAEQDPDRPGRLRLTRPGRTAFPVGLALLIAATTVQIVDDRAKVASARTANELQTKTKDLLDQVASYLAKPQIQATIKADAGLRTELDGILKAPILESMIRTVPELTELQNAIDRLRAGIPLESAIVRITQHGSPDDLKALLKAGANPNDVTGDIPIPPLGYAAMECDVEKVRVLLDNGADVNLVSPLNGDTALYTAANVGCLPVVELLLDRGANKDARNHLGQTPLHIAAFFGSDQVVDLLVRRGADRTIRNKSGRTPADEAQMVNHTALARRLRS